MHRPSSSSPGPFSAYLAALLVIIAAASAPIVIRQAQQAGVPSLYIIAVRLLLTSLILAPLVFKNHRHRTVLSRLHKREWLLIVGSSLAFALNLVLLFLALEYTSVLVTSVMRRTTPLWVIWLEVLFLGVAFTRKVWFGLLLTLIGGILVGLGSEGAIEAGRQPLLGACLALVGSVSVGLYLLIGRRFRNGLPSLVYSWLVFTGGTFFIFVSLLLTRTPFSGYSTAGYFWVIVVTFLTQFLGHIPMNYGLRYFPATIMSVILQVAVVVSGLLAFLFFNEAPSLTQMIGSLIILIGVLLVSWR